MARGQGAANDAAETIRVLHVDDDPAATELVERLLGGREWGFRVSTANSATEGLGRLRLRQFDCVVSDYDMPDMNGLAFFETLRAEGCDVPGILFTGHASDLLVEQARDHGVVETVSKGAGIEQYRTLAASIEQAVN
jgi:CheY-like chemotaxis protein